MTADTDGAPLLVPVDAFEAFSGESIAAEECCGVLDRHAFDAVFALALQWRTASTHHCPLWAFCNL